MDNDKLVPHDRDYTPAHSKIFNYWKDKTIFPDGTIGDLKSSNGLEVVEDWGEPCCWACGKQIDLSRYDGYADDIEKCNFGKIYGYAETRKHLQRCHIIPHSIGGSDDFEGNYFLLCKKCHEESPDTANPQNFFRWVYKKKSNSALSADFKTLYKLVKEECEEQGKDVRTASIANLTVTSGHGNGTSLSTMVYALVDSCKPKKRRKQKS